MTGTPDRLPEAEMRGPRREREIAQRIFGPISGPWYPAQNVSGVPQNFGTHIVLVGETIWMPMQWAIRCAATGRWRVGEPRAAYPVEPNTEVQLRRYPGFGDIVCAVAAAWNLHQRVENVRIYFDAPPEHRQWVSWVPFLRSGFAPKPANFLNLDVIEHDARWDRTSEMVRCLGLKFRGRHRPRFHFPIEVPAGTVRGWPDQPYALLAPWARRHAPERSIGRAALHDFLVAYRDTTDFPLVVVDRHATDLPEADGHVIINQTGSDLVNPSDLWIAARNAAFVVATDSGAMMVAAALGKPLVGVFQYRSPKARLALVETPWEAVTPAVRCAPCGEAGPQRCEAGLACASGIAGQDIIEGLKRLARRVASVAAAIGSATWYTA